MDGYQRLLSCSLYGNIFCLLGQKPDLCITWIMRGQQSTKRKFRTDTEMPEKPFAVKNTGKGKSGMT
ncbi:MAG: hypothetical protein NC121_18500 [Blautia sp.]|nr:hypothetical protein [Blautia sp.]